jgi:hypothetical protein
MAALAKFEGWPLHHYQVIHAIKFVRAGLRDDLLRNAGGKQDEA